MPNEGSPACAAPAVRVGYLLSHYPSANHTYLLREVRALREAGVEVAVVAIDGDSRPAGALTPEEREECAAAFVVKRTGVGGALWAHLATAAARPARYAAGLLAAVRLAGPDLGRLAFHLFYFGEAVIAGRWLQQARCAHVHTHYASTVALLAGRVFGFNLSATIHGSAEFIEPRAQRLREKIAACTFVRAISYYGRSQLMYASPPEEWHKLVVVRLGVDPGQFEPVRFGAASPEQGPSAATRPFRLTSVGQLQPAKGFPLLLDAVAILVRAGHDVTLTLVGGGAGRAALEARASSLGITDRVTFTGALGQPDVRALLGQTDAFVLSSFAEGIPVVLMEAMAAEVPCVASRITGIPELIEDGVSGLLFTPSDEHELARSVARLVGDPALCRFLGTRARERVCDHYDLRRNVGHLVDLLAAAARRG